MKLPPEGARWLVSLRWLACAAVFVSIWLTSSALSIIHNPAPLYLVACAMFAYNLAFRYNKQLVASAMLVYNLVFRRNLQRPPPPARGTSIAKSSSKSPSTSSP